ncbi:MAG: hypothetical protein H6739_40845 [Alphaproteobacteria bacterium]|nr:hypothetical protein [Alphaproteobacteria bacterium]
MNPILLLKAWHDQHREVSSDQGIDQTFSIDAGGQSARLDADSGSALGRATVWATGMCDIEVIDFEDGRLLMFLHVEATTEEALHSGLAEMIRWMRPGSRLHPHA